MSKVSREGTMTKKKKPIRLGVVRLEWQYVVDLDDDEMIERAKIALLEDIRSSIIRSPGELDESIVAVPSSEAKESDINDWLFDEGEEDS
jgi:hypothetical protein